MLATTMPRKPSAPTELGQFNIRMPKDLIAAIDEEVLETQRAHPGRMVTRSDLIREVLYAHFGARKTGKKKP